jgi:hypothetical protein
MEAFRQCLSTQNVYLFKTDVQQNKTESSSRNLSCCVSVVCYLLSYTPVNTTLPGPQQLRVIERSSVLLYCTYILSKEMVYVIRNQTGLIKVNWFLTNNNNKVTICNVKMAYFIIVICFESEIYT